MSQGPGGALQSLMTAGRKALEVASNGNGDIANGACGNRGLTQGFGAVGTRSAETGIWKPGEMRGAREAGSGHWAEKPVKWGEYTDS